MQIMDRDYLLLLFSTIKRIPLTLSLISSIWISSVSTVSLIASIVLSIVVIIIVISSLIVIVIIVVPSLVHTLLSIKSTHSNLAHCLSIILVVSITFSNSHHHALHPYWWIHHHVLPKHLPSHSTLALLSSSSIIIVSSVSSWLFVSCSTNLRPFAGKSSACILHSMKSLNARICKRVVFELKEGITFALVGLIIFH